jgi:hypothetical protein
MQEIAPARGESDCALLALATAEPPVEPGVAGVVDEFLQHAFCAHDLVVPVRSDQWLVVAKCPEGEADRIFDGVLKAWDEVRRDRPAGWLPGIRIDAKGSWPLAERDPIIQRFREGLLEEPFMPAPTVDCLSKTDGFHTCGS